MDTVAYEVLIDGLRFPEGPLALPNGDLLVSELQGAAVQRISPDGRLNQVAHVPGAPNGLAFGPDGGLYVANMGGFPEAIGELFPSCHADAIGYRGGSIQRVDVRTGEVADVCTHAADGERLRAPDDLVFDASGGCWFTDLGRFDTGGPSMDVTGIYFTALDGSPARLVAPATMPTNGIGITPDGRLWWTEYLTGRLLVRDIAGPGVLAEPAVRHGDCVFSHPAPITWFDSLTAMADDGVTVAVHDGSETGRSGVLSFDRTGALTAFAPFDDLYTTHIVFGGPDLRTAYVTLSVSGRIVTLPWPTAGHPAAFTPSV